MAVGLVVPTKHVDALAVDGTSTAEKAPSEALPSTQLLPSRREVLIECSVELSDLLGWTGDDVPILARSKAQASILQLRKVMDRCRNVAFGTSLGDCLCLLYTHNLHML